jgi:hypothetical protein
VAAAVDAATAVAAVVQRKSRRDSAGFELHAAQKQPAELRRRAIEILPGLVVVRGMLRRIKARF